MAKGLKTLIRLSKFNVDEKRRVLTTLQDREEQLLDFIRQHEEELEREKSVAADDAAGVGFAYSNYYRAWMDRRDQMNQTLLMLRAQIEMAREELAEAFRQQKTYEVTQTAREKREKEEADRKEQIFLDEVAQTQHRRKEEEAEEA